MIFKIYALTAPVLAKSVLVLWTRQRWQIRNMVELSVNRGMSRIYPSPLTHQHITESAGFI